MVALQWAPAHKGAEGNEVADEQAKAAAESPCDPVQRSILGEASLAFVSRSINQQHGEMDQRPR